MQLLQDTANRREDQLTWYRHVLINRLPADYINFNCVPKIRNTTNKNSSLFKYARDCFNLQAYLHGDETVPIDEIFRTNNLNKTYTNIVYSNRSELAETKSTIQMMKEELHDIKKQNNEIINDMNQKITQLEQNNKDLTVITNWKLNS